MIKADVGYWAKYENANEKPVIAWSSDGGAPRGKCRATAGGIPHRRFFRAG